MRILLIFATYFIVAAAIHAQGPVQRISLSNLQKANIVESSRAGQFGLTNSDGNQRYAQFTEIDLTPILYTPTATGNTANYSEFVTVPGGDIWYIDWQGRAIRLYNFAAATGDLDWLEIDTNTPPNNIADSMYTKSYASFNARMVWPGANVFVNDSINSADVVIQGNREARVGLYNLLSGAWSSFALNGNEQSVLLGGGANSFTVATSGGTPTVPSAPNIPHFRVSAADSTIRAHMYPSTRRDDEPTENFLYTDPSGILRSKSLAALPGAAIVYADPLCGPPVITPNDSLGPFLGWNTDCLEQWSWNGIEWVLEGSPGGGGVSGPDSTFRKVSGSYLYKRIGDNVYKQGTLGVRTTDTLGLVNLRDDTNTKPQINFGSNSSWLFNCPKDTRANSGLIQAFEFTKSFNDSASTSGDNQVYYLGINPNNRDITKPGMWLAWENSFNNPGNYRAYELHLPQITYPSVGTRRPISLYASNQSSIIAGHMSFDADYFSINDYKTATQKIIIGIGDQGTYQPHNQGISFLDSARIHFQINNFGGIFQRNAANSADITLIKANSTNEVVVGESNASRVKIPEHLLVSGTGLISNDAGEIRMGNTSFPTSTTFFSSAQNVTSYRRVGEPERFDIVMASGRWIVSPNSTGANVLDLHYQAPYNSITVGSTGKVGFGTISPVGKIHATTTSGKTQQMVTVENTTGSNSIFRSNVTPQSDITANIGDLGIVNDGTGALYGKYSGSATNTGWGKYLNLIDPNTATSGQVLTWSGSAWAPATPASIVNIYNSNGTFGTGRTATITDKIVFEKSTDALGGVVPFSLRVGGNDADFQSFVSPANNDSLHFRRVDGKGYGEFSNKNIIIQNTTNNVGLEIDGDTKTTIISGGLTTNSSSQQDITTTPATVSAGIHTVVLQPGAGTATLPEIGSTAGQMKQGTMIWVTNFSGGTATIAAFSGEQINTASSVTLADGQSAWVKSIGAADWAIIKSN